VRFSVTWSSIEKGLLAIAEGQPEAVEVETVEFLQKLGLIAASEESTDLSPLGERYYLARFVQQDPTGQKEALAEALQLQPIATAFCGALWSNQTVPVPGALSLLKRLRAGDELSAKRWLDFMNRAGWIAYNRANPVVRVLYNPEELVPPAEDAARERGRGHVISPDTGFGNLLALRELIRSARTFIRWYEQHLPAKVLEVLYREVEAGHVSEIRLLSGPANVDKTAKEDFKRFAKEMKTKRGIAAQWRILSKKDAFLHHDRFFLSDGIARNLPPLNTILKGSTGEILPSDLAPAEFDKWWTNGQPIESFTPTDDP
jgi:hypothetical protein